MRQQKRRECAMKVKIGQSLASATDTTTVVVVRAPETDVDLTCGGLPMITSPSAVSPALAAVGDGPGTQLGKRYEDQGQSLELLCTKAGTSTLAVGGAPMSLKKAKPLPASD
jgi:hypothetical protein